MLAEKQRQQLFFARRPELINITLTIPIILTVAFAGLLFNMRSRKLNPELKLSTAAH